MWNQQDVTENSTKNYILDFDFIFHIFSPRQQLKNEWYAAIS